jgi:hypothetical protein
VNEKKTKLSRNGIQIGASRPFWTQHNSRGNCIGALTDEELDATGLSQYKKIPFNPMMRAD